MVRECVGDKISWVDDEEGQPGALQHASNAVHVLRKYATDKEHVIVSG